MARRGRHDSGVTGCVVVDKPPGMTSHDVVDVLRRSLGTRKVGHAGTLDPDATGVLVLGVGKGTKLLQFVTGADKIYVGEIVFGSATSTLDAAGEVTGTWDMTVTPAEVAAAAAEFVGAIEQVPPMVSAVRIDGKRLHELAREGIEVDRPARAVTVHRYDTAPTSDPLVYTIDVHCSSGTYIRSLAADVGTALGGGAHLRNLRRTSVGPFTLDDAGSATEPVVLPLIEMLRGMPRLDVDQTVADRVRVGQSLGPSAGTGQFVIVGPGDEVLAVYEVRDGVMVPAKVLVG
jgi:tRNA pseudouridine55 synthase